MQFSIRMNEESNSGVCIAKGKRKIFSETYETDLTAGLFSDLFQLSLWSVVVIYKTNYKLERCTLMFEGRVNV